VIAAVQVARQLDLRIVALTGNGGGKMGPLLANDDVHICVPHKTTARIQEVHILALHCICDVIDCRMFSS
jgi:D-sedoheptulose 7-phosphate isomerase